MSARDDYRQIARLTDKNRWLHGEEATAALDEIDLLRDLLYEYGRHAEGCSAEFGDTYRCRCGWRTYVHHAQPTTQGEPT